MLEVVAALIWREGTFLIGQRAAGKANALLWEFIGGKVEAGETPAQALVRECMEETGVTVLQTTFFCDTTHVYFDRSIHLSLFEAVIAPGEPRCLEHNALRWISPEEIPQYDFCPADRAFLPLLTAAKS